MTERLDEGPSRTILGVRFFTGTPIGAVAIGLRGGLVVVPAAPALVDLETSSAYREALTGADLVITDSGLMVLVWRMLTGEKIERVSGLEYLKLLLEKPAIRERSAVLWIMPTAAARDRNLAWLQGQGHPVSADDCYLAPHYPGGKLQDDDLLKLVRSRRPAHIIVGLGGGTQERLGLFLKRSLDYRPGIHCIGAAIGFLSGEQVRIPMWVDYLYLGWLWRSVSAPRKFVPRYWKATRLVGLMVRYGAQAPVSEHRG